MIRIIAIAILALMAVGCTWQRSSFKEADGTEYSSMIMVGPFNKLEAGQAAFSYKWDQKGATVTANQSGDKYDNYTGQAAMLQAAIEAAVKAAIAGAAAGSQ